MTRWRRSTDKKNRNLYHQRKQNGSVSRLICFAHNSNGHIIKSGERCWGFWSLHAMTFYGFINRFSYDYGLHISLETFRLRTTGLHQGTVSIYWVRLFEPPWLILVIGWWVRFKALLSLLEEKTIPSAFFCSSDRLLYCLITHGKTVWISGGIGLGEETGRVTTNEYSVGVN